MPSFVARSLVLTTEQIDSEYQSIQRESFLYQGELGICGPVSVLHALQTENPQRLQELATEVLQHPSLIPRDLLEDPSLKQRRHPLSRILATHLLNEHNLFLTYHATASTKDLLAGASTGSEIKKWLREFFPDRSIVSYSSYCWGALSNAQKVNALWRHPDKKPIVIGILNGRFLESNENDPYRKFPPLLAACFACGHCIHILSPFEEVIPEVIRFKAYTWGHEQTFTFTTDEFNKMMWDLIVAY